MNFLSLSKQRELLRKEYEYEKAQFRHDTETMGVGRKVKRGECWFPIGIGRSYYNSLTILNMAAASVSLRKTAAEASIT